MSADSINEQRDITALLDSMPELSRIKVLAVWKGDTVAELDQVLAGMSSDGKPGGISISVLAPSESPEQENATLPIIRREHLVRIIELPSLNRTEPGVANPNLSGLIAEEVKDLVYQRLHARYIGNAQLQWMGSTPYSDEGDGHGYDVKFRIIGALASEIRSASPLMSVASDMLTITCTGTDGEQIYYVVDNSASVYDITRACYYIEPFAVQSGQIVHAVAIQTGKAFSNMTTKKIT